MMNPMNPMMMPNQINPMMIPNQINPMMIPNQINPMMMPNQINPMMMPNQINPMMIPNQINPMMMPNQMTMQNQMNQMMMGNLINLRQNKITITLLISDGKTFTEITETVDLNSEISILSQILKKHNIDIRECQINYNGAGVKLSSKTFAECNFVNGSKFIIVSTGGVGGGEVGSCAKSIADPTKKEPVEWPTTKGGPFYLIVKNGINIFGFCQNKECQAYKKEVCSPFGYGTFDLIEDLNTKSKKCPKCPACEYLLLEVESCGFMNCEYSYIGKKYENKELVDVKFHKKTKGGYKALDYIDPGKKGENKSTWVELKITAKKLNNK